MAGNGVFLMGFMPEQQIERVVAFARTQGLSRFAALVPETAYGTAVIEALRASAVRNESRVVRVEYYPADTADVELQVRRLARYDERQAALRAHRLTLEGRDDAASEAALAALESTQTIGRLDYDAVILPEGGPNLRSIASLLPYYDIDPNAIRFIGTYLWYEPGPRPRAGAGRRLVRGAATGPEGRVSRALRSLVRTRAAGDR